MGSLHFFPWEVTVKCTQFSSQGLIQCLIQLPKSYLKEETEWMNKLIMNPSIKRMNLRFSTNQQTTNQNDKPPQKKMQQQQQQQQPQLQPQPQPQPPTNPPTQHPFDWAPSDNWRCASVKAQPVAISRTRSIAIAPPRKLFMEGNNPSTWSQKKETFYIKDPNKKKHGKFQKWSRGPGKNAKIKVVCICSWFHFAWIRSGKF